MKAGRCVTGVFALGGSWFKSDLRFVRHGRQAWRVDDVHDALKNSDDGGFVDVESLFEFLFQRGELFGQLAFVPSRARI